MKSFNLVVLITATSLWMFACEENKAPESNTSLDLLRIEDASVSSKKEEKEFYIDQTDTQTDPVISKKRPQVDKQGKQDWDKKIIKTASLNFEVKDHKDYSSSLREKVKNAGGYIAQEEQTQSDYKIENTLTIKVPADQFDHAIDLFTNSVEKLNEKKISSQDVTAEYIDTRSRMEAKRQVRLRYLDLLKQVKNMEEILRVQSEINGIQEQIESGQGRIEFLNHSSVFSTISLTYYQILNFSAKDENQPSFWSKTGNAFKAGWSFTENLFIVLISVWPLYFIIAILLLLYKKYKSINLKKA